MTRNPILSVLFLLFLFGCQSLPQQSTLLVVESPTQTNTPTITYTPFHFPPTWTPTPFPSDTPYLSKSETPMPTLLTITPIISVLPITLSGYGGSNSYVFGLPAGYTTISWKYSGKGDPILLKFLYDTHLSLVEYIQNTYKIFYDYYTGIINDAIRSRDAVLVRDAQRDLAYYTDQYNRQMDEENKRYEAEIAQYKTSLVVKINRKSTNKPVLLISVTDVFTGVTSYQAQIANDYYLLVETPGQWEITLTPKK